MLIYSSLIHMCKYLTGWKSNNYAFIIELKASPYRHIMVLDLDEKFDLSILDRLSGRSMTGQSTDGTWA